MLAIFALKNIDWFGQPELSTFTCDESAGFGAVGGISGDIRTFPSYYHHNTAIQFKEILSAPKLQWIAKIHN